jgi:hypothetical protein
MTSKDRPSRSWLWRGLQLALIAVVGFGVYRSLAPELGRVGWSELTAFEPAVVPLVGSTLLLLAVYIAHAFLWRRIMEDLAIAKPSVRDTMRVYFLASLGRYIPGKLWQLAGLAVLASRAGFSAAGAAAAAVIGQLAFLTTGLIFLALLLPRLAEGTAALLGAVILGAAAASAWILLATQFASGARAWLLDRLPEAIRERLAGSLVLLARIRPSTALGWVFGYALTWVVLGIAFTVFVGAFVPGSIADSRHLAGTIAGAYLWGYIMVIAPGGLVVRELAMSGLLAQIPGFPAAAALVVPVASRIWFTIAEILPLGLVALMPRPHRPVADATTAEAE